MKINLIIFSLLLPTFLAGAQSRSISGRVADSISKSSLSGAHITLYTQPNNIIIYKGISNHDGHFVIDKLPSDKLLMEVSYLGYHFFHYEIEEGNKSILELEISLQPAAVEVGEVVVTSTRNDKMLRDVSLPLAVLNNRNIDEQPAITLANLFQDAAGVNMAKDGTWATSVNIRGLSEQRIVALVDGNRIETSTDVAGGLAMVDLNDIERIEVIKGAASSLYGTGALGGVVNIITKEGHYHDKFFAGGDIAGTYQSVNNLHSEHISLNLADEKWYARISGTNRDAGNTMTPVGELLNSQFSDKNVSLKIGVKPKKNHEINLIYQNFNAQDVGIPGGMAFTPASVAKYTDAHREMFSASYSVNKSTGKLNRIKFRYFHQNILKDVELKPNAVLTLTPTGNHTTNGFQVQTDWTFNDKHTVNAGIDIWQRYLSTNREKHIKTPVLDSLRGEVPIPNAWFTSGGVFIQDQIELFNSKLNLTIGGRFDLINTRNNQAVDPLYLIVNGTRNDSPGKQRITFEQNSINNTSWSLDAGALYHLTSKADLTLNLSRAYRAPSIEERFKYIDLGSSVRIGDPKLKPEDGYFIDLGTRFWMDRFQFSGNIFANAMSNLIVESPGIFIYNYSSNPANFDTLNALINSNVDKALLYGFDLSTAYNVFDGMTLKASGGFVRGMNRHTNTSLSQIPPLNGRFTAKYSLHGLFSTEVSANIVADQDKISIGEKTSKGYASYDLSIFSEPIKISRISIEVFGGIQNFTNRAYMLHLATNRGIIKYEQGRNFYMKLRLSF